MAKPQNLDKLALSVVSTLVAVTAWTLVIAGSFIPRWARPLNSSRTDANTTYSLWGREDCYGVICSTKYRDEHKEVKTWWFDEHGQKHVKVTQSVEKVPITTCVVANYCNITWYEEVDFTEVPSLLLVARAFIIPSFCAGFICIILYIIKIIVLVLRPSWRRIHIKAAYLTFSAMAGVSAGIAVVIYITMLEDQAYQLLWAPVLPGVGGCLFICISIVPHTIVKQTHSQESGQDVVNLVPAVTSGYLSWRNHPNDDDTEDRSEFSERVPSLHRRCQPGKHQQRGHTNGYQRNATRKDRDAEIF